MWKALNHGDKVSVGDTLRYRSNSFSQPLEGDTYVVIKTDQHYFEIIKEGDDSEAPEPPRRKAVRYLDVGYNVLIERWSEHQTSSISL